MAVDFTVISIGTLSRNPLWGEDQAVRTPHGTTTLITSGSETILVDPSLPGHVLDARLFERAGIHADDVTKVFLTTFRPCHRMGLADFDRATWYIHEQEKQAVRQQLSDMRSQSDPCDRRKDPVIEDTLSLLDRCRVAEDKLGDRVEIFPSPGSSPGTCGLLLTRSVGTVVVAGDAVISQEFLARGQVWHHSHDLNQALQSLQDILEVADIIVPGHDNVFPVMGKFFGV